MVLRRNYERSTISAFACNAPIAVNVEEHCGIMNILKL